MAMRRIATAIGMAAALLGIYLLYRVGQKYDFKEVADVLRESPPAAIAWTLLFTACSFTCVVLIEWLALTYVEAKAPVQRLIRTGIAAVGVGRSVGLSAFSSGGIRYRMYGRVGIKAMTVAKMLLFLASTVGVGMAGAGGLALIMDQGLSDLLGVSHQTVVTIGVGALLVDVAYLLLCAGFRRKITLLKVSLQLPPLRLALGQVILSALNFLCIAAALYSSLRAFVAVSYQAVAALYVGSDVVAMLGHVPGGWGVLEYIVTEALEGSRVLAGLVLFRAIYYLLPLTVGLTLFIADEMARRRLAERKKTASVAGAT